MSSWKQIETEAPIFAVRVQALFDAHRHKTIATLRADGSPRISGIEVAFTHGEVTLGFMPGSRKAADILRDPRIALHSASDDPIDDDPGRWPGDAKIAGVAVAIDGDDAGGMPAVRVRVDIREVVLTSIGSPADHLLIESWHEGRGMQRRERR